MPNESNKREGEFVAGEAAGVATLERAAVPPGVEEIVAAASGALAAWLGNWWAVPTAALLTAGVVARWLRRRRRSCRPPRRPQ
ncbi:hypothetical protein ACWERW_40210 [Streptomyces sp. NPDC004012]